MTTNNYFKNFNSWPQQELLNSLTKEVIQMSGIDCLYLPSVAVNKDNILGEDASRKFTSAQEVEMYINTPEGFGGAGDIISKFGLDVQDELILIVNKERFNDTVGFAVPKEGDLVYIKGLNKGLFDIKFVEHERPFYSLGKNTVFELTCELFQYSNETFDLSVTENKEVFDKIERENSTTILVTMASNTGYTISEDVYQGSSLANATAKAKVATQNGTALSLYRVSGDLATGTNLIGATSGTSMSISKIDQQDSPSTTYDDNKVFETEGDSILDFSELDPWSDNI